MFGLQMVVQVSEYLEGKPSFFGSVALSFSSPHVEHRSWFCRYRLAGGHTQLNDLTTKELETGLVGYKSLYGRVHGMHAAERRDHDNSFNLQPVRTLTQRC